MNTDSDYYLLLIDIRESTRLQGKKAQRVMERLEAEIRRLNRTLKPKPTIGLSINYGDEVAGLFISPLQFFDVVESMRDVLHPDVQLRFVAAKGKISVPSKDIRKVGGEVFKKADAAIQRLKKERRFSRWLLGDPILDTVLTALTEMSNAVLENMTSYQRMAFSLLKQGFSQKTVSKKLGKHPQSVSDAVKRGKADLLLEAHSAIRQMLARIDP
jgi:hypothetical protein